LIALVALLLCSLCRFSFRLDCTALSLSPTPPPTPTPHTYSDYGVWTHLCPAESKIWLKDNTNVLKEEVKNTTREYKKDKATKKAKWYVVIWSPMSISRTCNKRSHTGHESQTGHTKLHTYTHTHTYIHISHLYVCLLPTSLGTPSTQLATDRGGQAASPSVPGTA
jgi:hypothetical protein